MHIRDAALPLEGAAEGPVLVGVRPENMTLSDKGLAGAVIDIEPMGREVLYIIDTPLGQVRVLDSVSKNLPAVAAGETVQIAFDSGDSLVFDQATERRLTDVRVNLP